MWHLLRKKALRNYPVILKEIIAGGGVGKEIDPKITRALSKSHSCYVLITCDPPTESGSINVQMIYDGEPDTIAYLLTDAQSYMHSSVEASTSHLNQKVLPFDDNS